MSVDFSSASAPLPPDVPPYLIDDILNNVITEYVIFRINVIRDYDDPSTDDYGKIMADGVVHVHRNPLNRLKESARLGDITAKIDLGMRFASTSFMLTAINVKLRMYTSCKTPRDRPGAITLWTSIMDATPRASQTQQHAITAACLSHAYFESSYTPGDDAFEYDPLSSAGVYAQISIELGLNCPKVLSIAQALAKTDLRTHRTFRYFTGIWGLLDKRNSEIKAEEDKRNTKVTKTPLAYRCAADGCGIEGKNKTALRRCSGKCPAEFKPSYCSKECQKRVKTSLSCSRCTHADLRRALGLAAAQTYMPAIAG